MWVDALSRVVSALAEERCRFGLQSLNYRPRSRRRLLMAVSLLTAGCLLVGDGLAQEPPRFPIPPPPKLTIPPPPPRFPIPTSGFALWNECAPIGLLVERLSDDAADIDLTEERIQTLAESRLRAARMYDAAASTHLYVRVGVLVLENRTGAFNVEMSFNKYLREDVPEYWRNEMSDLKVMASTWDNGGIGTHGGDASFILQSVSEYLDRFVLEYLRVNEAACG